VIAVSSSSFSVSLVLAIERSRIPPVINTSAKDLAIIIPMLYEDHSEKITKPPNTGTTRLATENNGKTMTALLF